MPERRESATAVSSGAEAWCRLELLLELVESRATDLSLVATVPSCRVSAQEKENARLGPHVWRPCRRKHNGSAFAGAWFACSVHDARAHGMRFRHRSSIGDALGIGRSSSVLNPFAVRLRSVVPLAFTRTKGCPVQRDNAAHAEDQSCQDTDQREEKTGMRLTIQPLAPKESQSDGDR